MSNSEMNEDAIKTVFALSEKGAPGKCSMCGGPSVWYCLDATADSLSTIAIAGLSGKMEVVRFCCSRCGFIANFVREMAERVGDPDYDKGDLVEAERHMKEHCHE